MAPKVADRARALLGLTVPLGEAGTAGCAAKASEAVLLGLLLCKMLALPGRTELDLLGEAVFVSSGPAAKVWCFCGDLAAILSYAFRLQSSDTRNIIACMFSTLKALKLQVDGQATLD